MYFIKYTIFALAKDIIYAPLWWYSGGIAFLYSWIIRANIATWKMLGIDVWVKNIFTPMFQQYDWQGRIISFFMRLAQILARIVCFLIIFFVLAFLFVVWLIAPLLAFYLFYISIIHEILSRLFV